ncbi:MAG: BrnT family toxin [Melioribacteraceae bacterium]|jgi:uncharacterized DUF497 family protein|nr:BrnT family toxin [Melioribacteraceae bacterium]
MEFEFDNRKSESNKEKHGIIFFDAQELWQNKKRIEIPLKYVDENRFIIISKIGEEYWSAIYTYRKNKIRIISVRRSRENEKEIFES